MHRFTCPGLPAAWVNAWLAAIGTTVLDPRIRLHWTAENSPVAVLSSVDLDPVEALVESWPNATSLRELPLAEKWNGAGEVKRKVSVDQFVVRSRAARGHPHAWTLSSTMTDLSIDANGEVAHAPFDPPVPKGLTLYHRLLRVYQEAQPASKVRLSDSFVGKAERIEGNGLGFDNARLGSLADKSSKWIEPVVEFLAFFGLALLPVRGRGVDRRLSRYGDPDERQRGWQKPPRRDGPRRFVWPAWQQPLDSAGIDALLDAWNPWRRQALPCHETFVWTMDFPCGMLAPCHSPRSAAHCATRRRLRASRRSCLRSDSTVGPPWAGGSARSSRSPTRAAALSLPAA